MRSLAHLLGIDGAFCFCRLDGKYRYHLSIGGKVAMLELSDIGTVRRGGPAREPLGGRAALGHAAQHGQPAYRSACRKLSTAAALRSSRSRHASVGVSRRVECCISRTPSLLLSAKLRNQDLCAESAADRKTATSNGLKLTVGRAG